MGPGAKKEWPVVLLAQKILGKNRSGTHARYSIFDIRSSTRARYSIFDLAHMLDIQYSC